MWGWSLPSLSPRRVLRLLLAFAAGFVIWYLVRFPYSHLVVRAGAPVLTWMGGPPPEALIVVKKGEFFLDTGFNDQNQEPVLIKLQLFPVHWNLAFFLGLLFITPLSTLRSRWKYLFAASAALLASHVLYFIGGMLTNSGETFASKGMPILRPGLLKTLGFLTRGYSLTLDPFLPFLLFLPILLPRKARAPRPVLEGKGKKTSRKVGRNDPCPCGSGKKFKHCCGA